MPLWTAGTAPDLQTYVYWQSTNNANSHGMHWEVGRTPRTLKHNTKGTFANLLSNPIMTTDDAI